jgi:hypothetical protein
MSRKSEDYELQSEDYRKIDGVNEGVNDGINLNQAV